MIRSGRKRDSVWEHFQELTSDGKILAKCKTCGHVQSNKAARMKNHVKRCNAPSIFAVPEDDSEMPIPVIEIENMEDSEIVEEPPLKKKKIIQESMDSFTLKTTENEKMKIDVAIAKFFYGCNIAFSVAENELFKKMIKMLRPGYKPPTRKSLANDLLSKVHEKMEEEMKETIASKNATLVIDSWSNIHNDPITAACIQIGEKSFVVDVEDSGSKKKTAEYLTEKCRSIITNVQNKFQCKIKSVVSDNAKNMEKMRQALEDKDKVITYGCSAHWLNLLGEDITPSTIIKHVIEVQKYFRNHHAPAAWLKECNDHAKPQLPCNTRWNSQIACLETFIKNHSHYTKIINDHTSDIDLNIINIIRDFNLYSNVKDLLLQLKPVADALNIIQSNSSTLADSCHLWCSLMQNPILQSHYTKIKKRFNQALVPYHFVAYLLHPTYRGELMTYEQKENTRQFLEDIDSNYIPLVIKFDLKELPFPKTYFSPRVIESLTASKWWESISSVSDISKTFCDFISHLQVCCASSAAIERTFSNFSFIHSDIRNKLSVDTSAKLLFCYAMLKQC